jgi:hypothetical protein
MLILSKGIVGIPRLWALVTPAEANIPKKPRPAMIAVLALVFLVDRFIVFSIVLQS